MCLSKQHNSSSLLTKGEICPGLSVKTISTTVYLVFVLRIVAFRFSISCAVNGNEFVYWRANTHKTLRIFLFASQILPKANHANTLLFLANYPNPSKTWDLSASTVKTRSTNTFATFCYYMRNVKNSIYCNAASTFQPDFIWCITVPTCIHPSFESFCLKTSLAASLMAFSGVTRVRFTAAPGKDRQADDTQPLPPILHK